MKALVTGSNRGIGLELVRQLAGQGMEVIAVCRTPTTELSSIDARIIDGIDVTKGQDIDRLKQLVSNDKLDLLINNAGIMEPVSLDQMDMASIERQFQVNAISPLAVTHALLANLAQGSKVAIITSRMGSLDDNTSGGSYGYRMSKAAANMAGRSLSVDLKDAGIAVALLHPGWVRTDMTAGNGLIDADQSADGMIGIMDRLSLDLTGLFWHTNGEILAW